MNQEEALVELVLETAEQLASDVLNSGEGLEFLLANRWTREEIVARLQEMVSDPENVHI